MKNITPNGIEYTSNPIGEHTAVHKLHPKESDTDEDVKDAKLWLYSEKNTIGVIYVVRDTITNVPSKTKCSTCLFWKKETERFGMCGGQSDIVFAYDKTNTVNVKTPRFGTCSNYKSKK